MKTWTTTTDLLPWQQRGVEKIRRSRVGGLFMDMGTGKTRTAIELCEHRQNRISKAVWFCPVSLMETVRYEILKHTDCVSEDVYLFDEKSRPGRLPGAVWYVVGIESMGQSDRVTLAVAGLVDKSTFVIVDESTYIKGHTAKRTLRITRLAEKAKYRLILTGTPITQGVVDIYAQMRFLSNKILGYNSFYSFAANHLEYSENYPGMIVRAHNTDWLAAKINPYIYQVSKAECMDLPPKLFDSFYFHMTDQQQELYWTAKYEMLVDVPDDELLESYVIFRLFTALQQIVCGFWNRHENPWKKSKASAPELITVPHGRTNMLVRAIEADDADKVVIWANYQHSIGEIRERLRDEYGATSVAEFHGGIAARERGAQLDAFRGPARFLLATQATGGHGLTLNEATRHIFYSNGFKYSERIQAEDRSHRLGQSSPVTYVDLVCSGSIDERIQNALSKKEDTLTSFRRDVERYKDKSRSEVREMLRNL